MPTGSLSFRAHTFRNWDVERVFCRDWKPRHFLFLVCAYFISNVQWQSSKIDLFNVFKVLQNSVLLLGKYSPPSSWTRPSWITGRGCMWEGSLPCCCRLWHEWIQSSVHGWFGAVPFPKLRYIRSQGAGGVVVVVSLTMENHGTQHVSCLTILLHRSAVYAMRCSSCSVNNTDALLLLKRPFYSIKKYIHTLHLILKSA